MVKTVTLTAEVTPQRQLTIVLPQDIPTGWAELVLIIAPLATDAQTAHLMKERGTLYMPSPHFVHPSDATHFVATMEEIVDEQ